VVNSVQFAPNTAQAYKTNDKRNVKENQIINTGKENGVIVDIGKTRNKSATYSNPASRPSAMNIEDVDRLWEEADRATASLRKLVEDLIANQGKKARGVPSEKKTLLIDSKTRAEAEKMISDDGEWGVAAVSSRIVDFAKSLSGGDKSKIAVLRDAIEKGFKAAEEALGGELPDICKKTYDEVMKQLDQWEKEE
jgi:phosphoenolpyruvate-protein kinase (PTS system EI component)